MVNEDREGKEMNKGCVTKHMKLTSPEGHLFSQRYTTKKIKKLGYSYNFYQSLVKDAPVGAWSSKWVEYHTLVTWHNFGGIKPD